MTTNDEREPPKWQADATELDAAGPGPTMAPNVIILPYVSAEKGVMGWPPSNKENWASLYPSEIHKQQDRQVGCPIG